MFVKLFGVEIRTKSPLKWLQTLNFPPSLKCLCFWTEWQKVLMEALSGRGAFTCEDASASNHSKINYKPFDEKTILHQSWSIWKIKLSHGCWTEPFTAQQRHKRTWNLDLNSSARTWDHLTGLKLKPCVPISQHQMKKLTFKQYFCNILDITLCIIFLLLFSISWGSLDVWRPRRPEKSSSTWTTLHFLI